MGKLLIAEIKEKVLTPNGNTIATDYIKKKTDLTCDKFEKVATADTLLAVIDVIRPIDNKTVSTSRRKAMAIITENIKDYPTLVTPL